MIRVNKLTQMNMIFEGSVRCLRAKDELSPDDESLPIVKTTDNTDEIREYLDRASDSKRKRNILVLMKEPYRTSGGIEWNVGDHAMVGPTFAALLLKDYDLARKLLKWEKKLLLNGHIYQVDDLFPRWIPTYYIVCIQELFVVDPDIPEDIVMELDRKIRQNGEYCVFSDMYTNDYMGFIGKKPYPETIFCCDTESVKPYYSTIIERLRKEYPIVFEALLTDILQINWCGNDMKRYFNAKDLSAILRMICKYRSEEKEHIFRWFEEETSAVRGGRHHMFFYPPLPKRYINDVKMLYTVLKNSPEYFVEYMKIVTFLAMESNDEELLRIVKKVIRDKSLGLDVEALALYIWDIPEMHPLYQEIRNEYSHKDYLDYLANLIILFKKIKKEKICLSSESEIMRNYYSAVTNMGVRLDFWPCGIENKEEEHRSFREKMKKFLSSIDRIICDDLITSLREEGYERALMDIGDEELIVQNFECGLLRQDNCDRYIKWAVEYKSSQLIPAIIAFS